MTEPPTTSEGYSTDEFPSCLAWIERGSVLIRRMNSERIAEDPRLRRLLFPIATVPPEEPPLSAAASQEQPLALTPPPSTGPTLAPGESFEQVEAVTDGDQNKQEAENAAPNTYRVLLWTYRVQSSLQNALSYALFAKASEDGYFVPIAPRVYCVAPSYLTTFTKLFDAHASTRQWNAAVKLLTQLDTAISKRFEMGACVFDCGLFDGVKRQHHKPLVYDEFCDGRIASINFHRGPVPSMHSAFVIASTVSAWLDLNPTNVGILVAPNNEQMSVFATCCTLYCTDAASFPPTFAKELLEVYQQLIRGAESITTKLTRTFSGLDPKNVLYAGGMVPKPQSRFVDDFTSLLEMRDKKLTACADVPALLERKQKLTGVAVTPASQSIYIHEIRILNASLYNAATSTAAAVAAAAALPPETIAATASPPLSSSQSLTAPPVIYRPYFVLQNEKGVLFSSMVHGVRDANLTAGVHTYRVAKTLANCSDFTVKMYHLPFGRQGELVVDARLHATLLMDSATYSLGENEIGETTLSVDSGDFDCISGFHILPKGFQLQVRYARSASAFPTVPAAPAAASSAASPSLPPRPPTSTRSSFANELRQQEQAKVVRYDGPAIVTFLLDQPNVRTAFGDALLRKIDVIRRTSRGRLDIYLLYHVDISNGVGVPATSRVLPYRFLFRYILPDRVREKMLAMGATEESLNESAPSSFDVGTGMTFDEEYARWLQHMYDTDLNNAQGTFDGEVPSTVPAAELQPTLGYRSVSLPLPSGALEMSPPPPVTRPGRPQPRIRGAATSLIQQLPTYIYRGQNGERSDASQATTPDCLVCRCGFEVGEEIKSLPCFHSYHSDCIDSWLCLNKVCPVCQFSIDTQLSHDQLTHGDDFFPTPLSLPPPASS